jgi:hypothetical protein
LNKFKYGTTPAQELQIKVYANAFPTPISMFIKQVGNNTLALNFEESKKMEFEMMGCKEIQEYFRKKEVVQPKKSLILPRPQPKQTIEGKDKDTMDMESMQRMIK